MKSLVLALTLFALPALMALTTNAQSGPSVGVGGVLDHEGRRMDHPDYRKFRALEDQEERGLQLYRTGKYDRAYELLSEPARHGYKNSQHAVAQMHCEGLSVKKNILVGTALFGLAAESGDRKLELEYNKLLMSLPEEYRSLVAAQVDYYIARYGMEAQGVICERAKRPESHLTMTKCVKQPGKYTEYPWEPEG